MLINAHTRKSLMKKLYFSSILFAVSALSACGGSDTAESESTSVDLSYAGPALVSERVIDLSGHTVSVSSSSADKSSSLLVRQSNTSVNLTETAVFEWPQSSASIRGNLTFRLGVESDQAMDSIGLRWAGSDSEYTLCNADCGSQFNASIIGLNPILADQEPGELELQVWVNNGTNSVLAGRTFVGWQPFQIDNVSVTRDDAKITVEWQANTSLNRYNVYLASDPSLSSQNAVSLADGQQRLALEATSVQFESLSPEKDYFVLVTGVEGSGESASSGVIRVASQQLPPPQAPNAQNDTFELNEDSVVGGNVLDNDSPSEGLQIVVNETTQPLNGNLTINTDGTFSYQPAVNFFGQDQFSYTLVDEVGQLSSATVTLNVIPVNDAPVALSDEYQLDEQNQLVVSVPGVLANDVDIDNSVAELSVQVAELPATGTVTLNANGSFTYQAGAQFDLTDRFTYIVSDIDGLNSKAEVVINGPELNTAPVAQNDQYSVNEDSILIVNEQSSGILANDSDPDGDDISLVTTLVTTSQNGQLEVFDNGTFRYAPNANYYGVDSFTYQISDTQNNTATASVIIDVLPVVDNPVANNDSYHTKSGQVLEVIEADGLGSNDVNIDSLAIEYALSASGQPQNGEVDIQANGAFSYTPITNFIGTDTFNYDLLVGGQIVSSATVAIEVTPALNLFDVSLSGQEDTLLTGNVFDLFVGVDTSGLSVVNTGNINTSIGLLTLSVDGRYQLTPNLNQSGQFTQNLTFSDGQGLTQTVALTVTITPVNDAPVIALETVTLAEDSGLTSIDLTQFVTDVDGDTLVYSATSGQEASNGQLNISSAGIASYTPNINFNGTDSFGFTVTDSNNASTSALLTVTVTSVNDAPLATNVIESLNEDTSVTVNLMQYVSDLDGDSLVFDTAVNQPTTNGLVNVDASGQLTYTPSLNYFGSDSYVYSVMDPQGLIAQGMINFTVNAVNDVPEIFVEPVVTSEDSGVNTIDLTQFVTDVDGDALVYAVNSGQEASHGQLSISSAGIASYTPSVNFNGTDSFGFTVTDPNNASASALLSVTVNAVNDAPTASDISESLNEDASLDINLSSQVSDVDGDSLVFDVAVNQSTANGLINVDANGQLTYTPNLNFFGSDSFTYRVVDPQGLSDQGVITFTVNPVNDAPILVGTSLGSVAENLNDGSLIGTITATDIESDSLSYAIVGGDVSLFNIDSVTGAVTLNGSGVLNFELNQTHSIVVEVTDDGVPAQTSTQETFSIGVTDVTEALLPVESNAFGRAYTGYQEFYGDEQTGYFYATAENSGKIYFAGQINNIDKDIYITAYDKDGSFLTSFADDGEFILNLGADEVAKGIVAENGDLYVVFERAENDVQELCVLHLDTSGNISTSSGENNSGIRCTSEGKVLSAGGITFSSNKVYVVGNRDNGTELDSVFIKLDENTLSFEDSTPLYTDVSGANYDDKAYAIANFYSSELMIVGATKQGTDDWSPYVRYVESDGTNELSFNAGNDLIISIPGVVGSAELTSLAAIPDSNFTAYLGGYAETVVGSKDALVVALDKFGSLNGSFDLDGFSILDLDGDAGAGTEESQITAMTRSFDSDQIMMAGTVTSGASSQIVVGKVDSTASALNITFGTSGITQISDSVSLTANSLTVDENYVAWVAGGSGDSVVAPFIAAVENDANMYGCFPEDSAGCGMSGTLSVDLSGRERNDIAPTLIQIENGIHAGKYLLLVNTVKPTTEESLVLVQRYLSDGTVDASFGNAGIKQLYISNNTFANGIVEQSDGKLLLFGKSTNGAGEQVGFVARFSQDGIIDNTFGTDGVFTTDVLPDTANGEVKDIVFNPLSSFITAVASIDYLATVRPYILQLAPSGVLDTLTDTYNGPGSHFNTDGYRREDADISYTSITMDNSNRIIAAGTELTVDKNFWVNRFNSDGSKDVSFDGDGDRRVTRAAETDSLGTVITDNINNIYLLGSSTMGGTQSFAVKLLEAGVYDDNFSNNGRLKFENVSGAGTTSEIFDASFDSQGRMIVVGYGDNGSWLAGGIARIGTDGELDNLFGQSNGLYLTDSCSGNQSFKSMILNSDNQIVVVNQCEVGTDTSVSLSLFDFIEDGVQP